MPSPLAYLSTPLCCIFTFNCLHSQLAMVSFNNLNHHTKTLPYMDTTTSSFRKRKWDDTKPDVNDHDPKTSAVVDLHLETPLPSEWQRCLDIQSGEIHFYNTRTKKRTVKDPRPHDDPSPHMSLDLELNLPCGNYQKNTKASGIKTASLSLFSLSSDDNDQQEMVAAACKRCHMLVVLCKSSPACPNCKFMHPPDHTPPKLGFSCSLHVL